MAALACCAYANAQTSPQTTTFQVTTTVVSACVIDSASTLAFGSYAPTSGSALDQQSAIVLRCTSTTPYTLALNGGTTPGGTVGTRLMLNSGNSQTLQYNLYTSAGRTTVFGDGTGGSSTITGTGQGASLANQITVPVYGRIPSGQTVAPGSFSDTITATLTF
ncbi:MAG TPA: spore coat U domain-containing protein [Burkholderiaceae bacterium]|nr:spore coat U domain-containing protein [Burkholderiaceae bacterium]